MRSTRTFPPIPHPNWRALAQHEVFLYRRVADKGVALLAVGGTAKGTLGGGGLDAPSHFAALGGPGSDFVFGHLGYDLKNDLERLSSRHSDAMGFPDLHWFIPRWVFEFRGEATLLHAHEHDLTDGLALFQELAQTPSPADHTRADLQWQAKTPKKHYLSTAGRLLAHIQRGDIYEVNYCVEREAQVNHWDPYTAFPKLLERLDPPFGAFYRLGHRFALCASPERFLRIEAGRVHAQPMKGTRPRHADPRRDADLARELATDAKERSENIMAVDVVRNDLSRVAVPGTVRVEELCEVRRFPKVHQMVSSITAQLVPDMNVVDAIKASFPMASMTGAPKIRAMQLIDEAEDMRRGLFSGALGYFAPDGTVDLNVVIRTIQYRADTGRLSLITGSALTARCDLEKEWEECELKARSVIQALEP